MNEVIIPLMNVSRRTKAGVVDPNEILNKSQVYVTTAGYKGTFSYDKLIQLFVWSIVDPDLSFVFGGSWRIPVMHSLLDRNFVRDLKLDGTFNDSSFDREYESKWSGTIEDPFFRPELFDKYRVIKQPEYEASGRIGNAGYYMMSTDVGRIGCQSVTMIFKILPQTKGAAIKKLVNIFAYEEEHFGVQALQLKRLFYRFQPKEIVIDANGLGVGLMDFMVIETQDPITKETYPPFGVINDTNDLYKKFITPDTERDVIYALKANQEINSDAHSNVLSQMSSGKVVLLNDEREAKAKFLGTKLGKSATTKQRATFLRPFTLTSILKEEMLNLRENREGKYLALSKVNKKLEKDKFSAFEYGLYRIKRLEDGKKVKKRGNVSGYTFYTKR